MGKARNSYEIQRMLDIAKERETYKKNQKITAPKAYTKRADFSTVYYNDFTKSGRVLTLQAGSEALTKIGGLEAVGLLAEPETGVIPITVRGLNFPIVKIHWFYGDDNPIAHTTPWGSRYIKYYDKDGIQSHYSLPITIATFPVSIAAITTKFEALFNATDGTKKTLLGKRGIARLMIGRETLLSINA